MISNTWKHAGVGAICALLLGTSQKMINLLPHTQIDLAWFGLIGFFAATLLWEYSQYVRYGEKHYYWQMRWLDTLCDLIAGNACFSFVLWFGGLI